MPQHEHLERGERFLASREQKCATCGGGGKGFMKFGDEYVEIHCPDCGGSGKAQETAKSHLFHEKRVSRETDFKGQNGG